MADSLTTEETVPKAITRGRDILETFTARHYHGEPNPLTVEADAIRKDLLADLMHEAEAAGEDVEELLRRASTHYRSERDDDEQPEEERPRMVIEIDTTVADHDEAVALALIDTANQIMNGRTNGTVSLRGGSAGHFKSEYSD